MPCNDSCSLLLIKDLVCISQVLQWTRDWGTAQRLAYEFAQAVAAEFEALKEPMMGVVDWLVALKSVNVPCAVVTQLDR